MAAAASIAQTTGLSDAEETIAIAVFVALSSDTLPLSQVNEVADTMLAQRISSIDGIAQVQVGGSQKYAVRVRVDPRLLASRADAVRQITGAPVHEIVPDSVIEAADERGLAMVFTSVRVFRH